MRHCCCRFLAPRAQIFVTTISQLYIQSGLCFPAPAEQAVSARRVPTCEWRPAGAIRNNRMRSCSSAPSDVTWAE